MASQDLDTDVLQQIVESDERVTGKKVKRKTKKQTRTIPIPEGYKAFSDIFGYMPPSGINHAVRVFAPENWPEHMRAFIPEPDTHYVFPPEQTEAFVVGVEAGENVLFHGPKGTGKTTLPEQYCALTNRPYICVNGRRDLETGELLGKVSVEVASDASSATCVWHDGPVTEAVRHGALFAYDEISRTPAGVNTSIQKLLEDPRRLYLADKPGSSTDRWIKPHPEFKFVATDNTALQGDITGKYASTLVQDESLLDRFDTVIYLDYLDRPHEVDIVSKKSPGVPMETVEQMVTMANLVRSAYKEGKLQFTMSVRGLIKWARKTEYWDCPQRAFYYSFFNKLIEDDQKFVGEIYVKVFGVDPQNFDK